VKIRRRTNLLWGVVLLAVAIVYLLRALSLLPEGIYDVIVRAWPILLVLGGLSILLRDRIPLGGFIALVLSGILAAGVVTYGFSNRALQPRSDYQQAVNEAIAEGVTLLRIRIETLHYSFAPLARLPVDAAYAEDPRAGSDLVRQAVLPRLQILLDTHDPWRELRLGAGQETLWQRYAAERGLPASPVRVPVIHAPAVARRLPARSKTSERLAMAQRALEVVQTAAETASALAALWQNWQIGQARRKLLEAQRHLLHNAIQVQLEGQGRALDRALDRDFVRGYLADHAGDRAYDAVFGGDVTETPGQKGLATDRP